MCEVYLNPQNIVGWQKCTYARQIYVSWQNATLKIVYLKIHLILLNLKSHLNLILLNLKSHLNLNLKSHLNFKLEITSEFDTFKLEITFEFDTFKLEITSEF